MKKPIAFTTKPNKKLSAISAIVTLLLCMVIFSSSKSFSENRAMSAIEHFVTGFDLTGAHRHVECDGCHVQGIFKGLPSTCISCHNGTISIAKPTDHLLTNNPCDDCHSTSGWTNVRMDHSAVFGSCFSCHNGSIAPGKPGDHPPTSNICESCHVIARWSDINMDHNATAGSCFSCHNGVIAQGKPHDHPATNNSCENCHTTASWEDDD